MNERSNTAAGDEHIDAVLIALGSARPGDGFEQRLARRLAETPTRTLQHGLGRTKLRWSLALAGGGAMLFVALLVLPSHWRGHGLVTHRNSASSVQPKSAVAALQPRSTDAESPPVPAAADKQTSRLQRAVTGMQQRTGTVRTEADARAESPAKEASFPAPPMPLTEQERLLLRVAHRNDPEEIAMLNPVERGLQAARERAQSEKFFAPRPLPADLQQEINAALRSQYVNTPPPQELLAQTTTRSTP